MKRTLSLLTAVILGTSAQPQIASAAEEADAFRVDLATAFLTDYMWRGFNLYDGTSIQPSITASYDTGMGTLSANGWMHLSSEGDRQAEKFTEFDGTVAYALPLEPVTVKVGHIFYTYMNEEEPLAETNEVFAGLTLDDSAWNPFPLSPSFTFYQDYREYDNQYYELSFSHLFNCTGLGEGFNVTPYVTFAFASNAEDVYDDESGLVHITHGLNSTVALGDVQVIPSLNYTHQVDDATVNEFWAGFTLAYTF